MLAVSCSRGGAGACAGRRRPRCPRILLWRSFDVCSLVAGASRLQATRILPLAAPGRSLRLGAQTQQRSTHPPLALHLCLLLVAGASQLRLCLTAPFAASAFCASGSKWKHGAMVLTSSFKIHWALHGKHPANCAEQQNTKEVKERLKFAFVKCFRGLLVERTVRNASLSEALARASLVQASSPWTDQQKTPRDIMRPAVLGSPVVAGGRVPHGPCLQL